MVTHGKKDTLKNVMKSFTWGLKTSFQIWFPPQAGCQFQFLKRPVGCTVKAACHPWTGPSLPNRLMFCIWVTCQRERKCPHCQAATGAKSTKISTPWLVDKHLSLERSWWLIEILHAMVLNQILMASIDHDLDVDPGSLIGGCRHWPSKCLVNISTSLLHHVKLHTTSSIVDT